MNMLEELLGKDIAQALVVVLTIVGLGLLWDTLTKPLEAIKKSTDATERAAKEIRELLQEINSNSERTADALEELVERLRERADG